MSSFGSFLARALSREGLEVMAVDLDGEKIEKIKEEVHKAVIADGTDKAVLSRLGLTDMDGVVVSLGEMESSILATLHLKELKIRRIIVKALSEEHGRILEMVGATSVVFPEKDIAERLARTLSHENVLDYIPLIEGYSITEIAAPVSFIGKSLAELNLRAQYGVMVVVVKEMVPYKLVPVPHGNYVIKDSDVLVLMGADKDLKRLQK
jgi:trk system potassium uptake protein TrkA